MGLLGAVQDPQFRKDVARGLLDAGNRGAVAGLLGAPVDTAALVMGLLGYKNDAPVGGSEWIGQKMQDAGFVSPERNRLAEALAGVAIPAAANRLAPTLFAAEQKAAQNLAAPNRMNAATRGQAGAVMVLGKNAPAYPQSEALETARQNAVKMLGLPENNTPIDRAKALGFNTDAVHFSRHGVDVNTLDSGKFAIAPFDAVGTHVGTPQAALERFNNTMGYKVGNPDYAHDVLKGSTYPVVIKNQRPMLDATGKPYAETPLAMRWSESADYGNLRDSNAALRKDVFAKNDSIPYINDVESPGSLSYIVPPQNIRSRFAAFDPARVNESDLLGGASPKFLALLASLAGGAAAGGSYVKSREPK